MDIASITTILQGKTRWVGVKPALATGGLIVKYNRYDDVYIAPEDSDALIADLLATLPYKWSRPGKTPKGHWNELSRSKTRKS